MFDKREGEQELGFDPAALAGDGHVVFIGRIRSPWTTREDCPKNMTRRARTGLPAAVAIDEPYRRGLDGLERASHVVILTWLHHAGRNLIVQKPRHAASRKRRLRAALAGPANPVGLHVARLVSIDIDDRHAGARRDRCARRHAGDRLKPYFASVDSPCRRRPSGRLAS